MYGQIRLVELRAERPETWDFGDATHAKVVMPACADSETDMQEKGFTFADRTLRTTINVGKVSADLQKLQRMPIVETENHRDAIFRIAHASFTRDRRFHITPWCDQEVSALVLKVWADQLGPTLVCLFHDQPIGFLNLKDLGTESAETAIRKPETLFVHLAAVDEKYRLTGAAMGLYARAIQVARERGYRSLEGRISSLNTAVMNVYASFGAVFSDPEDVFLKALPR